MFSLIAVGIVVAVMAGGAAARSESTAAATTITPAQFAGRADSVCRRDANQQAALGPGLINADIVTRARLPRAVAYLDKIISITNSEVQQLAALPPTKTGIAQRNALVAALRTVLADERAASRAGHNGNLAGFRAAFDKFIRHGRPTGPDYRKVFRALNAAARIFPFKVCGKTSAVYP